jgi:hypothetical protein
MSAMMYPNHDVGPAAPGTARRTVEPMVVYASLSAGRLWPAVIIPLAAGAGWVTALVTDEPGWHAVALSALIQLPVFLLTVSSILARHRYQNLHEKIAKTTLTKCKTVEQGLQLLQCVAASQPDHVGARVPWPRNPREDAAGEPSPGHLPQASWDSGATGQISPGLADLLDHDHLGGTPNDCSPYLVWPRPQSEIDEDRPCFPV